jgi:hypothetical protein
MVTALFLGMLMLGLLLGVFAMLHGTEHLPRNVSLPAPHERTSEHVIDAEPSALFNIASGAAFVFAFGLQGTIGRITHHVPEDGTGEMQYTLDNRTYTLPARGVDGGALATDVEVVLDRVEAGVAYVEPWAQVEQRL